MIYFLIAVIFFSIGFGAGAFVFNKNNKDNIQSESFKAGWEAAKKKLEESKIFPIKKEVHSLSGRIKDVNDNSIVIETRLINPLDDESLKIRTVKIIPETIIEIRKEKDRETIKKEREEYNQRVEDFRKGKIKQLPPVPEIFIQEPAKIDDLKPGQIITVESKDNIREAKEFTASKIVIR